MQERNLAAIDLGTNSFHIIIVKVNQNGTFESLGKEKESVRLGSGSGPDEFITPDAIDRGINCLKRFKGLAAIHNAEIRLVATSALREAKNRQTFLDKAQKELGLNIEVVSGFEEARLIYFGILQGLPVFDKRIMLIDIGGGSTEILVGQKGNVDFAQSLKIGAIRLTDLFFVGDPDEDSDINQCKLHVEGMIAPYKREVEKLAPDLIIGSSGTIQSIAQMVLAEKEEEIPRSLNNFVFTSSELGKVRSILNSANTLKKRTKVPGLDLKRADIIVAGSIILEQIFKSFSIKSLTISDYALREGIIYDTIKKWEGRDQDHNASSLDNIRLKAINTLFEAFPYEADHVRKVNSLALKMFDDLQKLHQCSAEAREFLEAACLLHEIGFGISHSSHHKHSYYIIRNSELMVGFNFDEIEIIALVARYHRKNTPKSKHPEFSKISPTDQLLVKKLSAIIRIADGLDRSHQGIAEEIHCELQTDVVVFKVKTKKDLDPHIDIWSAQQKKDLFEEVYGKKCAFVVI